MLRESRPFFSTLPRPPNATPFPYTTLFRSHAGVHRRRARDGHRVLRRPAVAVRRSRPHDRRGDQPRRPRSEEHTSELQSHVNLVCRLLLEKKNDSAENKYWTLESYLRFIALDLIRQSDAS